MQNRAALSTALRAAREARGWSQEEAAEEAGRMLRAAAASSSIASSDDEREVWLSIEVSRYHVAGLESCPAAPLATMESRSRLLGLVLALDLDRGAINRIAGGL